MAAVQFGYSLPIFAWPGKGLFRAPNWQTLDATTTMSLGVYAEELGYDSLWVADHLMLGADEAILEGWTTISAIAGATKRAKLGVIHQAHYFRPPAITAKMTATLDQISGGRFILFYDYGQQLRENRAYGLPYPDSVEDRVRETVDGIRLIKELWTATEPTTIHSGSFSVIDATCTPGPVQQPHPPIWFGEVHPGLLAACAEFGQGWNTTPVSISELNRRLGLLKDACATAGTSYDAIEKSVELQVVISPEAGARSLLGELLEKAPDKAEADPALVSYISGETASPPDAIANTTLIGSPAEVTAQLRAYIDAGATHFILWFLDAPNRGGMELFAREVAPAFRGS
jgi:alkanesulfonate monooxygenase SsuD/methylene tetrahydromethanopterin reductase-like flavin-dependent oxidoreductase (luciferase family)